MNDRIPDPFSPLATEHIIDVVPMDFREEYRPVAGKPGEYRSVHKVNLLKKGTTNQSTPMSIPEIQQNQILWEFVEPYYNRWLKGQEDPVAGTPIDVLPFITPAQATHLKSLNIRSAEDLATTTDAAMERIGMGARRLRENTRAFLEAKGGADLAKENAELKAEQESLRSEIDELKTLVNQLAPKGKRRDAKNDSQ